MGILFLFQLVFLLLALVIGWAIPNGITNLGSTISSATVLRYMGTGPGMFGALIGIIGAAKRHRLVLFFTVVIDAWAIFWTFIAWALDFSNTVTLNNDITQGTVGTNSDGTQISLSTSHQRCAAAASFGLLGWVVMVIATYLAYALYQELDESPVPKATRPKSTTFKTPAAEKLPQSWSDMSQSQQPSQQYKPSPAKAVPNKATPATPTNRPAATSTSTGKLKTANQISSPQLASKPQPISGKKVAQHDSINETPHPKAKGGKTHFCGNCGKEWPEHIRFCGECGIPIANAADMWIEVFTPEGDKYLWNEATGESKWADD